MGHSSLEQNAKQFLQWEAIDAAALDSGKEMENILASILEKQTQDSLMLEKEKLMIGTPEALGQAMLNVIWDQFILQIGVVAGEDFIRENRGLTLDLRNDAHIQTTENFTKGNIANHNDLIDYQERYND